MRPLLLLGLIGCVPNSPDLLQPRIRVTGDVERDGEVLAFSGETLVDLEPALVGDTGFNTLGFLDGDEPAWIGLFIDGQGLLEPGDTVPIAHPARQERHARLDWQELETGFESRPFDNTGLPTDGVVTFLEPQDGAQRFAIEATIDGQRTLSLDVEWGAL